MPVSRIWNRLPGVLGLCLLTAVLLYAGGAFASVSEAPAAAVAAITSQTEETAAETSAAVSNSATPAEDPATPEGLLAHQVPLELDGAGTAWLLTSTALVLLMTLPGLALFYGGMVRRKNVIATIAQSAGVFAVATLVWFIVGYSLAFGVGSDALHPYIGNLRMLFLDGVTMETANGLLPGIPEYLWVSFQLTFAVITPALVTGAFAERMKYSALLLFTALWSVIVYAPIAHWVWGGGFLGEAGVLDFAGGAVVHVNSGVAGLVCALFLGARKGYGSEPIVAHNPVLTLIGASLLLVGWIGFNAGSAGAADALAGVALLNTLLAAAAASLAWKVIEVIEKRKPSLIGILSGIIAGLVAITPAAGFVEPKGAVIIGLAGGAVAYVASIWIKKLLRYDDSLDVFGIHGAAGLVGALLTGVFASTAINSASEGATVSAQALGLAGAIVWSALGTFVILLICKFTTGLRVRPEEEETGLDTVIHGEAVES